MKKNLVSHQLDRTTQASVAQPSSKRCTQNITQQL